MVETRGLVGMIEAADAMVKTANWDIQAHSAKAALAMRPGPGVPGAGQGSAGVRRGGLGAERTRCG